MDLMMMMSCHTVAWEKSVAMSACRKDGVVSIAVIVRYRNRIQSSSDSMVQVMSMIYRRKRRGPRTESCRIPGVSGNNEDLDQLITLHCSRLVSKDETHVSVLPRIPTDCGFPMATLFWASKSNSASWILSNSNPCHAKKCAGHYSLGHWRLVHSLLLA